MLGVCWRFVLLLNALFFLHSINGNIINQNVERSIDLSTQLVKTGFKIIAENSDEPITEYVFLQPEKNLAHISVKDDNNNAIQIKRETHGMIPQYVLVFDKPAKKQTFHIETISTKSIKPHPEEVKQNEKQLVKYTGTLYFNSPYKTKLQKTFVKLSSSNIISYTQVKPFSISSNKITLGPYENIEALQNQDMSIHYENHLPFLTVNYLERSIEVSHWGLIAVKEDITVTHTGAKLKGSFSRYEFQKDGRASQSAVKSYKTILPASATGVYYRDTNGNISTSNLNVLSDSVELELRPRFPLFGGWKTQYTLGYSVPTYEYLYNANTKYQLKMRVIDHIYNDMVVDEAVVKIVLPEGASNIKLITPYPIQRQSNELLYTYLDTVGRPVVSFTKSNMVENHIADFTVQYTFSKASLILEPLLVAGFIFIFFIFTIVLLRLDFSITSHFHKE